MNERMNHLGQPIGGELNQWEERPSPRRIVLQGKYCRLVPLDPVLHGAQLYQAFIEKDQEADWTYLPYGPFHNSKEFDVWLENACSGNDPLFYSVIDERSSQAIGLVSFLRIDPRVGVIEVGHIHFSACLQKTPMATEAMYLMMAYVFDELGYRRYEWKCDSCNQGSKKAALRLGFKYEGIFRQATLYKGRNRDTAWFSMLDKEWPELKEIFHKWLDEENFDDKGQQKCSLQDCR
ncbi:GNAT family protein [Neptunomonas sp.]|uniref:GNAT family N-acetyltransferase n=1 Tax=Neptunomonas sp. TaxID=1971898 RepID=UPI0025D9BEE6|nr:GNAT family protein [Neptunomonas sp.]